MAAGVSRYHVTVVEKELLPTISLKETKKKAKQQVILGSTKLDAIDYMIIIGMYCQKPSRTEKSYVDHLYMISGVSISESIVKLISEQAFPYSGKLCTVSLIPLANFRLINIKRAEEFMETLSKFPKKN